MGKIGVPVRHTPRTTARGAGTQWAGTAVALATEICIWQTIHFAVPIINS